MTGWCPKFVHESEPLPLPVDGLPDGKDGVARARIGQGQTVHAVGKGRPDHGFGSLLHQPSEVTHRTARDAPGFARAHLVATSAMFRTGGMRLLQPQ
jgi:hypothetical protein